MNENFDPYLFKRGMGHLFKKRLLDGNKQKGIQLDKLHVL